MYVAHHVDDSHVVYIASTQIFMMTDDEEEDETWWTSPKIWQEYLGIEHPQDCPDYEEEGPWRLLEDDTDERGNANAASSSNTVPPTEIKKRRACRGTKTRSKDAEEW